jgi:glucosamine kinase
MMTLDPNEGHVAAATELRILAVDGGQSTIRVRHSDAGTAEHDGVSRVADTDVRVVEAVEAAWTSLGRPAADRVVLGLTTAPTATDRALALAASIGTAIGAAEVWLCDDAVTSHAGALSLGWGVSIAAGTGVACLAIPDDGDPRIVGGHGYLLGDEGGAFWIGRAGIRAALRAIDGRGAPTSLTARAAARYGGIEAVDIRLHDDPRPVDAIARFAVDVLEAAETDDQAGAIVDDAAAELHALANAAAHAAAPANDALTADRGPTPVGLAGRLLAEGTSLRRALDARLATDPAVAPRTADGSPLDGAMLLGRQPTPGRYASLVHVWHPRRNA